MTLLEVPPYDIVVNDRARQDLVDIEELAESIRTVGLLEPIVCRRIGDKLRLVAGERRLAAAQALGLLTVPVHVRDGDDAWARLAEATENSQRKSFLPSEAVTLGARLIEDVEAGNLPTPEGRILDWVAKAVGMSRRTYEKARDIYSYEPTTPAGRHILEDIWERMDATGKVDGFWTELDALKRLEHVAGSSLPQADRAAATLGDVADGTLDIITARELVDGFIRPRPPEDEAAGVDPGADATPDEPTAGTASEGPGSGTETRQVPEPTLRAEPINPVYLPSGWDVCPGHPNLMDVATVLMEVHGDRCRGALFSVGRQRICQYRADENQAVEDALDIRWPGWRDLPTVPRPPKAVPGGPKKALAALAAWLEATRLALPEGWLDSGGPILDDRSTVAGGRHVPMDTPAGGYRCCAQYARGEWTYDATPNQAGGDDDADGKGSAGPSEMATELSASAAPAADDAGESASEPFATTSDQAEGIASLGAGREGVPGRLPRPGTPSTKGRNITARTVDHWCLLATRIVGLAEHIDEHQASEIEAVLAAAPDKRDRLLRDLEELETVIPYLQDVRLLARPPD